MFNNLTQLNTRDLIIQYLSLKDSCCDELSDELHLTKPDIQYHLRELLSKGIIKENGTTGENGTRGRPKKYYCINKTTHESLSPDLHKLLLLSIDRQGHANCDLIDAAILTIFGKPTESADYINKIRQLIDLLNSHRYQARWEIHREGIVISCRSCPYWAFNAETQFFCNMDKTLLINFTGLQVTSHKWKNDEGKFLCRFLLN